MRNFLYKKMAIEKGVYGDSQSGIQPTNTRTINTNTVDENSDNI